MDLEKELLSHGLTSLAVTLIALRIAQFFFAERISRWDGAIAMAEKALQEINSHKDVCDESNKLIIYKLEAIAGTLEKLSERDESRDKTINGLARDIAMMQGAQREREKH